MSDASEPVVAPLPERIYIVGMSEGELGGLIAILRDEEHRLEARLSHAVNAELRYDLTVDLRDVMDAINRLESIRDPRRP